MTSYNIELRPCFSLFDLFLSPKCGAVTVWKLTLKMLEKFLNFSVLFGAAGAAAF